MRSILNRNGFGDVNVNGPAIGYQNEYLASFSTSVASSGNVISDATWHHCKNLSPFFYNYYFSSPDYGDGPDYNVSDFYSTSMLDELIPVLISMQQAAAPIIE